MDCIVNVTQNWGIGKDGDLLVSISADLRRFRALTTGKTVIYGRKTLLTFPHARPLPNRENWILSATPGFSVPGAAVFPSLAALQEALRTRPADSLCLIGGASVYRALLPWCSRVLLTAGAKGKRSALPHSRVMLHQPLGGAQGQASDIEITAREILKTKRELYEILSVHSGVPVKKIEKDADRDYWLSAREAKDYGLIDEVLSKRDK